MYWYKREMSYAIVWSGGAAGPNENYVHREFATWHVIIQSTPTYPELRSIDPTNPLFNYALLCYRAGSSEMQDAMNDASWLVQATKQNNCMQYLLLTAECWMLNDEPRLVDDRWTMIDRLQKIFGRKNAWRDAKQSSWAQYLSIVPSWTAILGEG